MSVRALACSVLLGLVFAGGIAMAQEVPDQQVGSPTSGLDGRVVLAVRCPVPVGDDTGICPSPPLLTTLTIYTADNLTEIAEVTTDSSGAFSIELEPGMYVVEVAHERLLVSVKPSVLATFTFRVPARSLE